MACNACQSECMCAIIPGSPGVAVNGSGTGMDPYTVHINPCDWFGITSANTGRNITNMDRAIVKNQYGACELVVVPGISVTNGAAHQLAIPVGGDMHIVGVPGSGISTSISGNTLSINYNPTAGCEQIQDCVGQMLSNVGFSYDDTNNRYASTGVNGRVLVSNGLGGATWQPGPPATGYISTEVRTLDRGDSLSTVGQFEVSSNLVMFAGQGLRIDTANGSMAFYVRTPITTLAEVGILCGDSMGAPVYPSTSGLRTLPPSTSAQYGRPAAGNGAGIGSGGTVMARVDIAIANPSTCRDATFMTVNSFGFQSVHVPNGIKGIVAGQAGVTLFGHPYQVYEVARWSPEGPQTAAPEYRFDTTSTIGDTGTIAAGGTYNHTCYSIVANGSTYAITGSATVAASALLVTI